MRLRGSKLLSHLGHIADRLRSDDGVDLFEQSWAPADPEAVLALVHGYGEHSGRYQHVAEALAARGIASLALDHFGHGLYPDVVTGLEYERIMSASGPTGGALVRPSNGEQPKKVAWIQCVGSRGINREDVPYCSGVCCMYALKEAIVTKERFRGDIEATIFYMDMRGLGRSFDRYRRSAEQVGVRLVRARVHELVALPDGGVRVRHGALGSELVEHDEFDLVDENGTTARHSQPTPRGWKRARRSGRCRCKECAGCPCREG